MEIKSRVMEVIHSAIDELNENHHGCKKVPKDPETILFGKKGFLDSLGLVNLIVAVEQGIEDAFGITLTLADEKALAQETNPFKTIESLVDYVSALLKEQADG